MPTNDRFVAPELINGRLVRAADPGEMERYGGLKRDFTDLASYSRETELDLADLERMYPRADGVVYPQVFGGAPQYFDSLRYSFYPGIDRGEPLATRGTEACVLTAEEEAATEPSRGNLKRYSLSAETLADDLTAQLAIEAEELIGYSLLRRKLKIVGPLTRCLAALGVEPLEESAVKQYMQEMIVFHRAEMKRALTWRTVSRMKWVEVSIRSCCERGIEIPEFALARCTQIAKAMQAGDLAVDFTVEKLMDVDPFMKVEASDESFYLDVWDESKFEAAL